MSNSLITKKALANSLKELTKRLPLNKISVKSIVNDCGLNRQTFYYHFEDIYDLVEWIYKTEGLESIEESRSYDTWIDGVKKVFLYIENNKEFCCNTLNSLGRNHLDNYLYSVTNDLVMGVVDEVSIGMNVKENDKEFIANFYSLAFTGLVTKWMKEGMREESNIIIKRLSDLVEGNFLKALQRYESKSC
ncbi:dihydroxyacetone kinase transcriptional activator DhaS [Clostridium uliginosum]|uniref:Probable dihydroxyacetone kinase regulator n=1 Tax=Clostridium uliginosum TaxID=119641 RepID=A0A1I1PPC0_9CLOT|nr:dihydroxyacetone kinase transcriptional activator DhaS [Clostridium uliginosum]SFD11616.1 probable dihydroxyacetone kinase regulator [Clostridium uliginosum]